MRKHQALQILRDYNKYRRGKFDQAWLARQGCTPILIGEAIEFAVDHLDILCRFGPVVEDRKINHPVTHKGYRRVNHGV